MESLSKQFSTQFVAMLTVLAQQVSNDKWKEINAHYTGSAKSGNDFLFICLPKIMNGIQADDTEIKKYSEECISLLMDIVSTKIIDYISYHGFSEEVGMDPVKVYYFIVETLFEKKVFKDLEPLMLYYNHMFTSFDQNGYFAQLFDKIKTVSKKGMQEVKSKYGEYGAYSTFKLTYFLLKEKEVAL